MKPPAGTIELLRRWSGGDQQARDQLISHVYDELRVLARRALRREKQAGALQPTALVHEVYVRLLGRREVDFQDRAHFFALTATVMRQVLVDHARARLAARRGGGAPHLQVDEYSAATQPDHEVLAVDQALRRLEALDERKCRVVEMKFFAGYSEREIAGLLGVARATVERDWTFARTWLHLQMETPPPTT